MGIKSNQRLTVDSLQKASLIGDGKSSWSHVTHVAV